MIPSGAMIPSPTPLWAGATIGELLGPVSVAGVVVILVTLGVIIAAVARGQRPSAVSGRSGAPCEQVSPPSGQESRHAA